MSMIPAVADKPVTDLSQRAIQLARAIDRLSPGRYMVSILLPDVEAVSWKVEIERVEPIQKMVITKYSPE